jgi:hypothetical protein
LAEHVIAWGPLSARKVEQAIDAIVDQVDPGALRRAVVLKQRVEEMARSVCEDDPRTLGERRSEALAAIAAGIPQLACECGSSECAAAARDARRPATAVIHVVAQADSVDAAHAEAAGGVAPPVPAPAEPDVDAMSTVEQGHVPPAFCPAPGAENTQAPPASCPAPPALVIGAGVMPAPLLAATVERATLREIRHPAVRHPSRTIGPRERWPIRAVPGSDLSVAGLR